MKPFLDTNTYILSMIGCVLAGILLGIGLLGWLGSRKPRKKAYDTVSPADRWSERGYDPTNYINGGTVKYTATGTCENRTFQNNGRRRKA